MAFHGWILTVIAFAVCASGCALLDEQSDLDYKTVVESPNRDRRSAEEKYERAMAVYERGDLDRAERLLQEALTDDVTYGPAHNALGKLYFDQGKYYLAAWEFQYVINLMPERPEPHNNLGLVMEAVGKLEDAIASYSTAVELAPENPVYLGNCVRAYHRNGNRDQFVRYQLEQLIFLDSRPDWVAWANERLALDKFNGDDMESPPIPDPPRELVPTPGPAFPRGELPTPPSNFPVPLEPARSQGAAATIIQPRQIPLPAPVTSSRLVPP
jgi:Tfp pilus assembly protein PilF